MSDEKRKQIVDTRLNSLADGIDSLESAIGFEPETVEKDADIITRLNDIESRLVEIEAQLDAIQDLGREKTTKEEKIAALVQFAMNQATDPREDRVTLEVSDIKGVTGVSRRYAYDLLDDLDEDYEWASDRKNIEQYGDLQIDKDAQNAAIVIDLEALHSNEEAVNKFTTRTSEGGVSA
jgi:hypothetical protein